MLIVILTVIATYTVTTFILASRRIFKVIDLHEEHQFVRSREQKAHIKSHALILRSGFMNDIKWFIHLPRKLKNAFDWLSAE